MMNKWLKILGLGLLVLFCLNLIALQRIYFMAGDPFEYPADYKPKLMKVRLNAENVKPFLFGYSSLVADLLWIYTIVEMDLKLPSQKEYNLYYTLTHLFTDLDPYFEPLYIYGSSQFMFGRQGTSKQKEALDDSHEVLLKGWEFYLNRTEEWNHFHQYWMIPQLLGFNYYFEYNEKEKALPYYEYIANHVPHAPPLYRTFAGEIYKNLNQKDENMAFLESVLMKETLIEQLSLNRDNEEVKERIRRKMIYMQGGAVSQEAVDLYIQKAMEKSQSIFEIWRNQYPYLTIEDFVSLHPEVYNGKLASDVSMFEVLFHPDEESL
ncbi:MAG: hypothetical protein KDK51_06980 [Deltaproteobacteria bacterium]|nr:hypothetical protein [Deltaproteobacteria bacterium]